MVSSFCFPPPTSVTNSSTFIPHLGFFNYDKESAGLLFCPLFVDFHSWHCTPCVPSFPPPYLKILIGCRSTASSHLPLIIQVFVSVLLWDYKPKLPKKLDHRSVSYQVVHPCIQRTVCRAPRVKFRCWKSLLDFRLGFWDIDIYVNRSPW